MEKTLQAIYLRSDLSSQSLSAMSLAQLILKIVFSYTKPVTVINLKREIKKVLGTEIGKNRIEDSLQMLVDEDKIQRNDKEYYLSRNKRDLIEKAKQVFNERMDRVIDKFFGKAETPKAEIIEWFQDVTIEFFSRYKTAWIASKVKSKNGGDHYPMLIDAITSVTNKNKAIVKEDKSWLIHQYESFIHDKDEDVESIIWDYGMCAFSASFITASTSADQLSVDTVKNSIFLFDTNILMYLGLEKGEYYECYASLEKILNELKILPAYLDITRNEYVQTMSNKSQEIINIVNKYDREVLSETDDEFIKTALHRNCENVEDFQRFFMDSLIPPESFPGGLPIIKYDNSELLKIVEDAVKDEDLINELDSIYKSRTKHYKYTIQLEEDAQDQNELNRFRSKNRRALEHDAGLIKGAQHIKKSEKCFIISRDITVKDYGAKHSIRDEPDIVIGLDTLISILAIDNGGIDVDPTNFKPLFANLIRMSLIPEKGSFQVEDLSKFLEIETHFNQLPTDDIIDIAKEYSIGRMRGESDKKLALLLSRRYEASKTKMFSEISDSKAEFDKNRTYYNDLLQNVVQSKELLRCNYRSKLNRKYRRHYWFKLFWFFFWISAIPFILILAAKLIFKFNVITTIWDYIIAGFISSIIGFGINKISNFSTIREKYNEDREGIEVQVEIEIEKAIIALSKQKKNYL